MAQANKEGILSVEASTPQGLSEGLTTLGEQAKGRFVSLNIYGPHILVRQFDYPKIKMSELKNALLLEAVELLHLPAHQIDLDYHLKINTADKMKGIFMAAPKSLVKEYLDVCDMAKFSPVEMTASIVTGVESFLRKNDLEKKVTGDSFCLLDFRSDNRIHLAAFETDNCVLMREIRYDDPAEIEQEVMNSLRYSTARSSLKQFNQIYLSGASSNVNGLLARLEKEFEVKPTEGDFTDDSSSVTLKNRLFKVNLLKKYAVSFPVRKKVVRLTAIALAVALVACAIAGFGVMKQNKKIKELKSSFTETEYAKAKDLRKKIDLLHRDQ